MARIRSIKPEFQRDFRGHFIKKAISAAVRREVAIRYGCAPGETITAKCSYCDTKGQISWIQQPSDRSSGWVAFAGLELDHVIPEIAGGESTSNNITLACRSCNRSKGVNTVDKWGGSA